MTDYYPLIGRVVAGLDKNTAEARRVIYDAARTRLVEEFRKADPALSEAALTHERLALERAIRKLEAEQLALLAREP